jgi:23S rRNA (uracil1939-C5)-methyltransferase
MDHEDNPVAGTNAGGEAHVADIHDIALPSGHGVTRLDDLVVFVPGALPGDRVRFRVVKREKRFGYAALLDIVDASPMRVEPQCPHTGQCGGCDLQALAYESQLACKENHLRQVLMRVGREDLEGVALSPMAPSADRFSYRGKIEFSFGEAQGRLVIGLKGRASPTGLEASPVVPVDGCPLFGPVAAEVLPLLREEAGGCGLAPYDPRTGKGVLRRLVLREAKGTGQVMVHLVAATGTGGRLDRLLKGLPGKVAGLKNIYLTEGSRPRLLWGEPAIDELLSGLRLRIYPLSFFQPNPRTAELLYGCIPEAAGMRGGERVVGLYCGAGSLELFLARRAGTVEGIDSSRESIACARENAKLNDIGNCRFLEEKAERATARAGAGRGDLVVVDPPRRGMSPEALAAIARIGPERIVYVSCNPSTLARGLAGLRRGYRARWMMPFDFFPHTAHFEVLTVLERRGGPPGRRPCGSRSAP